MGNSPEFTLRVGNATDPQTLDPQLLVDLQQIAIARGLFEGLVILDEETLEPIPAVAERWEISRDGCVYTFFLRQNLRWSDGKPLTATDFTFALQRILSPQLCSPAVELIFPIKNARAYYEGKVSWDAVGVCAIDEHRLQIVLQRPTPHFLSLLAHPAWSPLPQRVVEACGSITQRDSSWTRAGKMVSNGPYRLREWHVGNRVSLEKNPYYRDDLREAPARIIFYSIGDAITEQNAFDGGEIDITATIPPDRVDMLRRNDPESLSEVASLGVFYYMFQCEREPLSNIHLR
ncbi:MAG: peptide ABC transporter substrate-binding protein, partial [Puniceicoccales bacterium]|nr:peptide ABC transporter substrate-binding protein [Puniceicoccales bacterium]